MRMQAWGTMKSEGCTDEPLEGELALQSLRPALLACQNRGGPQGDVTAD